MNREEAHKHKKRKSSGGLFVGGIFVAVCVSVLIAFLFALGGAGFEEIFLNENYWLTVGVVNGMLLIGFLLMYRIDAQNVAMNENDLEDTEWLTTKKLRKLKEFTVTTWDKVADKDDEIVIGAEKKGKAVEIISTSALHALIVGTTGSGKTTGFVDQNIAILGRSKGKPSMIIADPKKELYEKHAKQLESEGYKISTLDLREPYSSARWNPMQVLIRRIRQVRELQFNMKQDGNKYLACGEVFQSHGDARTRVQELKDEIFENAMDLVYTLCPIQNKDQPTWEEGARNLIFGLVLAFCEDVISGKMDEKQLQLFNVYHNITKYCSEDTTALKKYLLEGREEFSKVRGLVNTVLITSDKTLTSYLSEVNSYIQQLSDDGILSMTSENDIDIANMDESPNALFVIVPDERFTRHRFVTLFLTQTYKELVEKANTNLRKKDTDTAILKRRAYFILDEFGNLPKMENIEGMVTVGRSRGIRYLFVLQSFSQLNAKYGKDIGDIIKTNCNVKIFIGSDDPDTRREFSELCGQKKVKNFSVNTSAENPASSNTGASNQPLITIGMLERLNGNEKGDAIVSVRGYEPIWSRFTPSYELKEVYFAAGKADISKREARLFDKSEYVFDILGGSQKEEEEKQLDAIERREEEQAQEEKEKIPDFAALDKAWNDKVKEVHERILRVAQMLADEDAKALMETKLEHKQMLIAMLLKEYTDISTQQKLNTLDKYLSKELPKLLELQKQAKK